MSCFIDDLFGSKITLQNNKIYIISRWKIVTKTIDHLIVKGMNSLDITLNTSRSSRPEVFCKKSVLRNFTKFTEKHLCWSLSFNKVVTPFFIRTPLVAASEY